MAYIKPLPEEVFKKLKKDIKNTSVNKELIKKSKDILDELLKKK